MTKSKNPRILIVTPEVTYLPHGMGNVTGTLSAKAGGLADVSAALVGTLFELGADVHVALPDYRSLFNAQLSPIIKREFNTIRNKMPDDRVHLAEDRAFFYINRVYSDYSSENTKISLAFQREVINNIVPYVQPDLIHCNDWMTGLIPAMSRQLGIPCLFTIHNIHTQKIFLSYIEDRGIDAASFWHYLYYEHITSNYEQARETNPVDLLTSGVFSAHFVNTVSSTFLKEITEGNHSFIEYPLHLELTNKVNSQCATGILNSPDPSYNPLTDKSLKCRYCADNFIEGKLENKRFIQKTVGIIRDDNAPLFFWPSRLDTIQKGCQLLAEILYDIIAKYYQLNLEIIFVANGDFQRHFRNIIEFHKLQEYVALCDFNENLSRIAFGAADFILMPSLFEPCGLPQMIAPIYGALPVAHNTGGIHDSITHLDIEKNTGNGFLFNDYDSNGLSWCIDQAMQFYRLSKEIKQKHIYRIMNESISTFNHSVTAKKYINLYEKMLKRPLIK